MIVKFTLALGVVFLITAIAGMATGGHDHNLVIFGINTPHNIVHLASGIAALIAGVMGFRASRMFCLTFGIVYGAVTVLGFLNFAPVVDLLNINMADNFLHLAISVPCLGMWAASKSEALVS